MTIIQNEVDKIDKQITELISYKNFISSIDLSKLYTFEDWYRLNKAQMSNFEIRTQLLINIFPHATDFSNGINYIQFKLYGFDIVVPTILDSSIKIDLQSWRFHIQGETIESFEEHVHNDIVVTRNYIQSIDNKEHWFKSLSILFPEAYKLNRIKAYILWIWLSKYKWKSIDEKNRLIVTEELVKYDRYIENYKDSEKRNAEYREKLVKIVLPDLLSWTTNILPKSYLESDLLQELIDEVNHRKI